MRITITIFFVFLLFFNRALANDRYVQEIIDEYESNQARFHQKYRGRIFTYKGIVDSIKSDFLGSGEVYYIHLNVNNSTVSCSTNDREKASRLDKGNEVDFKGEVYDVVFGVLNLKKCIIDKTFKEMNGFNGEFYNFYGKCKGKVTNNTVSINDDGSKIECETLKDFNGKNFEYCPNTLDKGEIVDLSQKWINLDTGVDVYCVDHGLCYNAKDFKLEGNCSLKKGNY